MCVFGSVSTQTPWCTCGWCCPLRIVCWRSLHYGPEDLIWVRPPPLSILLRTAWWWIRSVSSVRSGGKNSAHEHTGPLTMRLHNGAYIMFRSSLSHTGRWSSWCCIWKPHSCWPPRCTWPKLRSSLPSSILPRPSNKVSWYISCKNNSDDKKCVCIREVELLQSTTSPGP